MFEEIAEEMVKSNDNIDRMQIYESRDPDWSFAQIKMASWNGSLVCVEVIDRDQGDIEAMIRKVATIHNDKLKVPE